MEVIVAKSAGFCFGVRRAIDIVNREAESGEKPIYTYGPIIHNEQVVEDLERRGVRVIEEDHLADIHSGTIIIRSHGVGRAVQEQMEAQGLRVVDATCPFVKKIHRTVDEATAEGRTVIIIGNGIIRRCRESWAGAVPDHMWWKDRRTLGGNAACCPG